MLRETLGYEPPSFSKPPRAPPEPKLETKELHGARHQIPMLMQIPQGSKNNIYPSPLFDERPSVKNLLRSASPSGKKASPGEKAPFKDVPLRKALHSAPPPLR